MYEMLTGHLPFESDDNDELTSLRINQDPSSPRVYNPKISVPLEKIILKVLSREPAQRYRTADQLGQVLSTFIQQSANPYFTPPPLSEAITAPVVKSVTQRKTQPVNSSATSADVKVNPSRTDWKTIWLELACVLAVGGLFPLWLYIWLFIRNVIH
jgi:serine/threonine protein kinase